MKSRHRPRRVAIAAIALFLVGVSIAALSGCTTKVVTAPAAQPLNTVTASGNGKVSAAPDEAVMTFGVTKQSPDAKKALKAASAVGKEITEALKQAGIDAKDIQTQNVSVYPQQTTQGNKVIITGYDASLVVTTKVRDIERLGDVITAANEAGANSINGPAFIISEESPYRAQAIDKAVADARKSAEAMAKAAGKSVGEVVSMSTSNVTVPIPMGGVAYSADAAKASVPIEPGQLDVSADVTVVFELK